MMGDEGDPPEDDSTVQVNGTAGDTGDSGAKGGKGLKGNQGEVGDQGDEGVTGLKGQKVCSHDCCYYVLKRFFKGFGGYQW